MSIKLSLFASQPSDLGRLTENVPMVDASVEVVTHTGTVRELMSELGRSRPQLAVADFTNSSTADLALLESTIRQTPQTAVILLTSDRSTEFLLTAMRIGVREVVPTPLMNGELKGAMLRQVERMQLAKVASKSGKVIGFISAKGGSGATLLSSSVAVSTSRLGHKVGYFDANSHFGDACMYLTSHTPTSFFPDLVRSLDRMDIEFLKASMMPINSTLWASAAADTPERAAEVKANGLDQVIQIARQAFDLVILDIGRSVDPATIKAMDICDELYVVMQYTVPSIHDARRLMAITSSLGYARDKVRVVANRIQKGTDIGADDVQRALNVLVRHQFPNSWAASVYTANHGTPLMEHAPKDPLTRAVAEFSAGLLPAPKESKVDAPNWLGSIFGGRKA
jgi:pilus assembly protein CpaE